MTMAGFTCSNYGYKPTKERCQTTVIIIMCKGQTVCIPWISSLSDLLRNVLLSPLPPCLYVRIIESLSQSWIFCDPSQQNVIFSLCIIYIAPSCSVELCLHWYLSSLSRDHNPSFINFIWTLYACQSCVSSNGVSTGIRAIDAPYMAHIPTTTYASGGEYLHNTAYNGACHYFHLVSMRKDLSVLLCKI